MGKYKLLSGKEVIKTLERLGFTQARQRGSHVVMKKVLTDGSTVGCVVPLHKQVATGTLHAILKQVQVTADTFYKQT